MTDINLKLAHSIANSFHATTGLELEDLYQEACLAQVEAVQSAKFDESKSSLTTFIWMRMRNHLIDHCRQRGREPGPTVSLDQPMDAGDTEGDGELPRYEPAYEVSPYDVVEFADDIGELSPDARAICEIVLSRPEEYATAGQKLARSRLKDELRDGGWSWPKLWSAMRELRHFFSDHVNANEAQSV